MAGPPTTMKSAGRMKKASGKSILIGSLRARSSARCRRLVRSRSACERSVCAMLAPSRSLWMMRPASAFRSSTPLRSPSPRSASSRVRPLRSSKATCANSRPRASSMPARSSPMRAMAALRPRPASRQVTMRSRVSGSAVVSSCTRRLTLTRSQRVTSAWPPSPTRAARSKVYASGLPEEMRGTTTNSAGPKLSSVRMPRKSTTARGPRMPAYESRWASEFSLPPKLYVPSRASRRAPRPGPFFFFVWASRSGTRVFKRCATGDSADSQEYPETMAMVTIPNVRSVRTTMITMSHLDAHDALDEDVTEEDTAEPVARHVQTRLARHHRPEVLGVEENQGDGDEERERGQHHPGEAALRGEHPHLAQKLEALADGVADVVEHLREVAAHLLRDHHAGREDGQVGIFHALGQMLERLADGEPKADLLRDLGELARDRVGKLFCHHLKRGEEAVPRLQRRSDQVERVGQLLAEEGQALAAQTQHDHEREEPGDHGRHRCEGRLADEERDEEERRRGKQQHVEHHLAHALLQTRLPDHPHQVLRDPELLKEHVQRADAREAPVLDQRRGRAANRRAGHGGEAAAECLLRFLAILRPSRDRVADQGEECEQEQRNDASHSAHLTSPQPR